MQDWAINYQTIVNRYESTIRAQFFGHVHFDTCEIFYEALDANNGILTKSADTEKDNERYPFRPTSVAFINPSATTNPAENSAYTIFTVDGFYPNTTWV